MISQIQPKKKNTQGALLSEVNGVHLQIPEFQTYFLCKICNSMHVVQNTRQILAIALPRL